MLYYINNNGGSYIALFHVQYMLKTLHTLSPQQACFVLHIYFFWISTLEYTVPIAADYTRSRYYHPQYKLTQCQVPNLIAWVGWNTWPEIENLLELCPEKVCRTDNFRHQPESNTSGLPDWRLSQLRHIYYVYTVLYRTEPGPSWVMWW